MRMKLYRPNAAAILQRPDGLVLLCRRADLPDFWQFPQGGIHPGESAREAVHREVLEEAGFAPESYTIRRQTGPLRYDFPPGVKKRGFDGQEQTWFLCLLHKPDVEVDPAATDGEFTEFRWILPEDLPWEAVPAMKHAVYRSVLAEFFGPH